MEREPEQMMRLKREMESREERWGEAKEATATREVNLSQRERAVTKLERELAAKQTQLVEASATWEAAMSKTRGDAVERGKVEAEQRAVWTAEQLKGERLVATVAEQRQQLEVALKVEVASLSLAMEEQRRREETSDETRIEREKQLKQR